MNSILSKYFVSYSEMLHSQFEICIVHATSGYCVLKTFLNQKTTLIIDFHVVS